MHDRRRFLSASAALALPVLGGGLAFRAADAVEAACRGCGDDPVSAEALRQFTGAVRALLKTSKGEHARGAAAALRVMAANAEARNHDAEFRRAVERESKTYGRDNVLMRPFDRDQYEATARELGMARAPELLAAATLDDRRRALDALLAGGVTAHLRRAASVFEAAGARLDAGGPVQRVQTKEQQIAMCRDLQTYIFSAEAAMIVACLIGGPLACAYFSGVYLGARLYYETQTDCSRWI